MKNKLVFSMMLVGLVSVGLTLSGCEDKKKKEAEMKAATEAAAKRRDDSIKAATPPPPPAPMVAGVMLGKEIDQTTKAVKATASEFKAKDQVYATVMVDNGVAGNEVKAKWMMGDKEVFAATEKVANAGKSNLQFNLANKNGLPVGDYKVEISLNGAAVKTEAFKVSK
jgi:hypothetical protein